MKTRNPHIHRFPTPPSQDREGLTRALERHGEYLLTSLDFSKLEERVLALSKEEPSL